MPNKKRKLLLTVAAERFLLAFILKKMSVFQFSKRYVFFKKCFGIVFLVPKSPNRPKFISPAEFSWFVLVVISTSGKLRFVMTEG